MLITCPTCTAVYRVEDSAVGPNGRNVQCDSCGAQWRQAPKAQAPVEEELFDELEIEDAPEEEAPIAAARPKTPGLEEAAELLHEMREESERTDSNAIFGGGAAEAAKPEKDAARKRDDLVTEAQIRATIASANKKSPNAAAREGGGGFRVGFLIALMFIAALVVVYLANGLLAEQFPAAASILGAYADAVDGLRAMVEKTADGAMQ